MRVAPCLVQHGGKSEVDMSTPVHAVATPLNTCRASRARRACRAVLSDKRDTARHDFFLQCQNAWARWRVVSCRDVTQQVEFGPIESRTLHASAASSLCLYIQAALSMLVFLWRRRTIESAAAITFQCCHSCFLGGGGQSSGFLGCAVNFFNTKHKQ